MLGLSCKCQQRARGCGPGAGLLGRTRFPRSTPATRPNLRVWRENTKNDSKKSELLPPVFNEFIANFIADLSRKYTKISLKSVPEACAVPFQGDLEHVFLIFGHFFVHESRRLPIKTGGSSSLFLL